MRILYGLKCLETNIMLLKVFRCLVTAKDVFISVEPYLIFGLKWLLMFIGRFEMGEWSIFGRTSGDQI